jgi:hypothetical protein
VLIDKCIDDYTDKDIYENCSVYAMSEKEQASGDPIQSAIKKVVNTATEPLETKEIHERVVAKQGDVSRSKLLYRLNDLRGEGIIQGKSVGSGKGVWIWWKKQK